ncbi:MAG: transcription elongation factor GreA [Clostridia bacterium]|nr:transcription elongation factor GreA [Clostridia bacterium]MBR2221095.1 transcription elongation factor GreA [Clostridia bacterium]MBR2433097.1 transcription elongation factor GreA [Clostridia bacterium]
MKIYLTLEGKKELEDKLEYLKTVKREEVTKAIGAAREYGDLSENSEYDAAKEAQGVLESEILEIETKLRDCIIIDKKNIDTSKVSLGCFVKVFDKDFDEEVEYKIVGSTESNPLKGFISNESPVGLALLNASVGDVVSVQTPMGVSKLKVLDIHS